MRKSFSILTVFLFVITNCYSQVAYYDAVALNGLLVNGKLPYSTAPDAQTQAIMSKYCLILKKYIPNGNSLTDPGKIVAAFVDPNGVNSNPFIAPFINTNGQAGAISFAVPLGSGLSLGSIGGANVTNIADGIAQFLVERAKEELFIAFFEKVPDFLANKCPELGVLFPSTVTLVNNFQSWQYDNFLNTLKEAFDKDLQNLLTNIPKLKSLKIDSSSWSKSVQNRVNTIKKFLTQKDGWILQSALAVGSGFISGQSLPVVFNSVADPDSIRQSLSTVADPSLLHSDLINALELADVFSYSLASNKAGENYVDAPSIAAMFAPGNENLRNLYFGLVYQEIKNADIQISGVTITSLLTPGQVNGAITYINNFITQTTDITNAIKALKDAKTKGSKDLTDQWSAIFQAADQFFNYLGQINTIDPTIQLPADFNKVITMSRQVAQTANDILIRNYNAAIVSLLNMITSNIQPDDKKTLSAHLQGFVKYTSFAANLISAKNSADAKNAIESIALPAGSASIKKNKSFNIALNAYIGGFYGNEYVSSLQSGNWSPVTGLTAPIGITISKRLRFNNCTWGSISGYITLLDVGAFASYRLKDTSTAPLPNVTLANIFAPGLGLVYGIPKVPISIGYLRQLGPELRDINSNKATITSDKMNNRWLFFLAVDIPILNFYTSAK